MGFENGGVDEARFNGPLYVTFSGDGSYSSIRRGKQLHPKNYETTW